MTFGKFSISNVFSLKSFVKVIIVNVIVDPENPGIVSVSPVGGGSGSAPCREFGQSSGRWILDQRRVVSLVSPAEQVGSSVTRAAESCHVAPSKMK